MRVFHQQVWNTYLVNSYQYTDFRTADIMGAVDMIHVGGYTTQVTGASPTLSVLTFGSSDGQDWTIWNYLITTLPLSTTQETLFQAMDSDPSSGPRWRYLRLALSLGGTNPRAMVRVWVTGRDRSRRSKELTLPPGNLL